jgi:hypothetical protein
MNNQQGFIKEIIGYLSGLGYGLYTPEDKPLFLRKDASHPMVLVIVVFGDALVFEFLGQELGREQLSLEVLKEVLPSYEAAVDGTLEDAGVDDKTNDMVMLGLNTSARNDQNAQSE